MKGNTIMAITWKPTANQTQNGVDEAGNRFQINHILETVTVRTPDGFLGHSWTTNGALDDATLKRKEARKSYLPPPVFILAPANSETDDLNYWADRATALLGQPSQILCGWL